ncbi:MAG: Holliday junction branch migration protein RuvA [Clostridiales bacterium]|jgi:Holliday junction DNA helicase RuvA|nr:Holliday junction branch migration protein RuvA [Clostridiales bacterium]
MISFLRGKLIQLNDDSLVIDINGIGFDIIVSQNTLDKFTDLYSVISIYTYLVVRDDSLVLYGFSSIEEKKMFLNLITVAGVGPRVAISILSGMPLKSLALAIVSEDSTTLAKIKGIGKKTAERLIVDLKEKIIKDNASLVTQLGEVTDSESQIINEAIEALASLGIARADAMVAINKSKEDNWDGTLESLIYNALRSMNKY